MKDHKIADQICKKIGYSIPKLLIFDAINSIENWVKDQILEHKVIQVHNLGTFTLVKIKYIIFGKEYSRNEIRFRPDVNLKEVPKLETKKDKGEL